MAVKQFDVVLAGASESAIRQGIVHGFVQAASFATDLPTILANIAAMPASVAVLSGLRPDLLPQYHAFLAAIRLAFNVCVTAPTNAMTGGVLQTIYDIGDTQTWQPACLS